MLEQGGKTKMGGIDFENVSFDMLIVNDENLEEHLTKQPAAIAYFGFLYKQAERNYDDIKKVYELRWKEMYSQCASELATSTEKKKSTINDIEALVYGKHKTELEQLNSRIMERRAEKDNLEVFYDAWKQKGFIITSRVQMALTGFMQKDTGGQSNDNVSKDDVSKPDVFKKDTSEDSASLLRDYRQKCKLEQEEKKK